MNVTIAYREVRQWPGKQTPREQRTRAPFKAHATRLWDLLYRELWMVSAREITLSGYWRPRDFKRDGGVYADARPAEPGIVLEFVRGEDRMRFACDRFPVWLDNVDAIGRSLEALRMMDRYGVMSGQQYEGFKALPTSVPMAPSRDAALEVIAFFAGLEVGAVERSDANTLLQAVRVARTKTHPDRGGSHEAFVRVQAAAQVLTPGGV